MRQSHNPHSAKDRDKEKVKAVRSVSKGTVITEQCGP
jgi:hypothetical protein